MADETIETIRTLLESVLEQCEDDEMNYKLRTALQLLEVERSRMDRLHVAADDDEKLKERLRNLGYLD